MVALTDSPSSLIVGTNSTGWRPIGSSDFLHDERLRARPSSDTDHTVTLGITCKAGDKVTILVVDGHLDYAASSCAPAVEPVAM